MQARCFRGLGLLAVIALSGCFRFGYRSTSIEQPITAAREVEMLARGATLDACLAVFGAPLYVWRAARDRTALAWGWRESAGWGFAVSYSVDARAPGASFSYDAMANELEGFVAWFDDEHRLIATQRGWLRDLTAPIRRQGRAP